MRLAFGRFAKVNSRKDGETVVSAHYEKQRWLHCDCRPDMKRAPTLFLVGGTHIQREPTGAGTPHREDCEFAREAPEQMRLLQSYREPPPKEEQLNLVRNFSDDSVPTLRCTQHVTTNRSRPTLARVLCALLYKANLHRFYPTDPMCGDRDNQLKHLEDAAESFFLAPNQKLSDWMATSLLQYYDLKKRLEEQPKGWKRPHGLFIATFNRIENNILYPTRADRKPILVTGKLTTFGEGDVLRRPPYLVIGLVTQPKRDAKHVELLNAYAHPCVAWNRLTLVDSQLERETLALIFSCRDQLAKNHGIEMTIRKPLFDVGQPETEDSRELCLPDFVLSCRGAAVRHPLVVIETMGYDDPVYRERKRRMDALFERIGKSPDLVPVVKHDRFKPDMTDKEVDRLFCVAVCEAISGQCPT